MLVVILSGYSNFNSAFFQFLSMSKGRQAWSQIMKIWRLCKKTGVYSMWFGKKQNSGIISIITDKQFNSFLAMLVHLSSTLKTKTLDQVGYTQQKCISHSSESQEIQDQSNDKFIVWQGVAFGFIDGWLHIVSLHGRKGKGISFRPLL